MEFVGPIEIVVEGGFQVPQIMMYRVKQNFPRQTIDDIEERIGLEMERAEIKEKVKPGMKVAVCVGSRGIAKLPVIVKTVIDILKERKCEPFIVPAMGSHGGATAEGQKYVLEHLGVTESLMGVDICSSMEVVNLGTTETGLPIFFDKNA